MQERVFLGIGNKPFMDIQPSEAAINDRAINYVLIGRGKYLEHMLWSFLVISWFLMFGHTSFNRNMFTLVPAENKVGSSLGSCSTHSGLPERRPKSVGSGSSSSSSSSSGRGSISPVRFVGGPKRRMVSGGLVGFASPAGAVEEDEMDNECGNQNLLCE